MWGWMLAKVIFMTLLPKVQGPYVFELAPETYKLDVPKHYPTPIRKIYKRQRIQRVHRNSRHTMFYIHH